jgi:hypothetical protein
MKGRKQKISGKETWPQKNRTASQGYVGGQTFMWITENNLTDDNPLYKLESKLKEPPCTEQYARWCGRSKQELILFLLPDWLLVIPLDP